MSSVREQLLGGKVMAKLEAVRVALGWTTLVRNPRDPLGDSELNGIVLMDGGERAPGSLSGHVERRTVDLSIGLLVRETEDDTAEELLDAGYVAVSDALLDPDDIQLDGLAESIEQGDTSDPVYGRPQGSARLLGGMIMDFSITYLAREGDASTPGP